MATTASRAGVVGAAVWVLVSGCRSSPASPTCADVAFAEPCWLEARGQDCYMWNRVPIAGEWVDYEGECKGGKVHGEGAATWSNGYGYIGEFKDGNRHGQGALVYPDRHKYVGGWKDGKRHGQGTLTWPDGTKYVGGWKDAKKHGHPRRLRTS